MKILISLSHLLLLCLLISCKAMNKTSVNEVNIPSDIGNKNYKILFLELSFGNTVSRNVGNVHNNSAEKYLEKKFKGAGIFIKQSEINSSLYADAKVYRYILINKISHQLKKTYKYSGSNRGIEEVTSYISSFYFIDKETGKEYPFVGSSTAALWMFKAIVDKVNGYF